MSHDSVQNKNGVNPHPLCIRYCIETKCKTEAEEALARRLHAWQRMCELLSPDGSCLIDNGVLLNAMFDIIEREYTGLPTAAQAGNS